MRRSDYKTRKNNARIACITATLVLTCFIAQTTPFIIADSSDSDSRGTAYSDPTEETVVSTNKWTFRRRRKKSRRKERTRFAWWYHKYLDGGGHTNWSGDPESIDNSSVIVETECEVIVRTRPEASFEGQEFISELNTEGKDVAQLISAFAKSVMNCKAYFERFSDGFMLMAFGKNEHTAKRGGGYMVEMIDRNGLLWEPLLELSKYEADHYARITIEWTDFDPEKVEPVGSEGHNRRGSWGLGKNTTAIIAVLASLSIISVGKILGGSIVSGLAVPFLMGSHEWTFRKSIQMETHANPSSQRAFERLGPVQSWSGDPFQNIGDAHDGGDKPAEAIVSLYDGEHSLPPAKASIYTNGLHEHIQAVKDGGEISKEERLGALKGEMAHLNIECFHTVGLEGSEEDDEISWFGMAKKALDRLTKNRFFWFFRAQNATSEDQDRRGSWGEGKFTLESASLLGAHISLSIRKTASGLSRVLMGLTTLRWHAIYNPTKGYGTADKKDGKVTPDQFAPYGTFSRSKKDETGEGYAPMPIVDVDYLDQFSRDFRLVRKDERGLSTVIMQPRHELRDTAVLARAIIARWWISIIEGLLVVKINHNGKSVYEIDSSSLRDVIASLDWDSEPEKIGSKNERNPAKLSIEQWDGLLDLHEWSQNPPSEAVFETEVAGEQGASKKPTWYSLLSDDQLDAIRNRGKGGQPCMVRLRTWVHQIGSDPEIGEIEYIFKPANEDLQAQVYTRRGMTIPFISQIEGLISIVRCDGDDNILESLLRDSEGPAHLEWSGGAPRVGSAAQKWVYGKSTVNLANDGLRAIKASCNFISIDDHEWAEGFFIEIEGDKETPKERRCKTCNRLMGQCTCKCPVCGELKTDCNGHKTPDFVGVPTSMPDGKVRLMRQGSFSGAGRVIKVRLAYERARRSPFSSWSPNDFDHDDISVDETGAIVKSVTSRKGDKDNGGVEVTLLIDDDDFEVLMWGWAADRDVRVSITEVI